MPVRRPSEILEVAAETGLAKTNTTSPPLLGRLLVSSALAGAFIALGGTLALVLGQNISPALRGYAPFLPSLISGAVFPIGLMLVVVLGADLFTGNNALLVPPMFQGRLSPWKVCANWLLVWLGNFAGCLAVAYFLVYLPGLTDPEKMPLVHDAVTAMARAKVNASFGTIFLKGIGANWCVCLAVWLALAGRRLGEKLLACEIPVFAFVALGYEHCVANMFFIPLGMLNGAEVSVFQLFASNLLPATLGNIAGGAIFVACVQIYLWSRK